MSVLSYYTIAVRDFTKYAQERDVNSVVSIFESTRTLTRCTGKTLVFAQAIIGSPFDIVFDGTRTMRYLWASEALQLYLSTTFCQSPSASSSV